jgi:cytidylate kinase
MKPGIIVAIDGPVASGKGTMARKMAQRFGGTYLDSGAMYRAFGLYLIENGLDVQQEDSINKGLGDVHITLSGDQVLLNGENVSERIRTQLVSMAASHVGKFQRVHELLMNTRRDIARAETEQGRIVVTEGRNEGTVTFPHAEVKIFLTADVKARALRRFAQEQRKGSGISLEEIDEQVRKRDEQDMQRAYAPLTANPKEHGYTILDNTDLTEQETEEKLIEIIEEKN